jgi:transcriptional regulator with XRE-family HTH domain
MTGQELKAARLSSAWTQNDAAEKLGITQAYLSMVERGTRAVSDELAARAVSVLKVPATALPLGQYPLRRPDGAYFQKALGSLGYPGFAYLKRSTKINPAELLLVALNSENLDSRVVEALPWLPFAYPNMDWTWLISNAKSRDRQNRLAFVTDLAAQVAGDKSDTAVEKILLGMIETLGRSRLAAEDTLCNQGLTDAERKWLRTHRSATAKHWNLLTDLSFERLTHAF